jgi:hypothetical protein
VKKRDEGADAPSAAVAVTSTNRECGRNVQTKERRGCVGGAQCAVACREAFFLVVGWLSRKRVGLQSCRPSRNKVALGRFLLPPRVAFTSQREKG